MRSSAQPLPRSPRRATREQEQPRATRRPVQLELFGESSASREAVRPRLLPNPDAYRLELLRRLNRYAAGRLRDLKLTDNRRTILSVRPATDRARLELRIHRSFLEASEEVVRAVAEFVESKKGSERARQALVTIREHFSQYRGTGIRRKPVLRPEGATLDLRQVVDDLNRRYFEGRLAVDITWGRSSTGASGHRCQRGRTASLQLGSYSYEDNLIRLHRVLDDPGVPRHVVEAVVHHELLHADMPPEIHNGRRYFHTPEFRRRERLFRQLDRANTWIQEHLPELLRARKENARRTRRS
jgi:predicted metal-dependent hydrolase